MYERYSRSISAPSAHFRKLFHGIRAWPFGLLTDSPSSKLHFEGGRQVLVLFEGPPQHEGFVDVLEQQEDQQQRQRGQQVHQSSRPSSTRTIKEI